MIQQWYNKVQPWWRAIYYYTSNLKELVEQKTVEGPMNECSAQVTQKLRTTFKMLLRELYVNQWWTWSKF